MARQSKWLLPDFTRARKQGAIDLSACRAVVTLMLLAAQALWSAEQEPKGTERICRIMPVGDSITEGGKSFSCYRYPLREKLLAAGYHFEYVGSRHSESRSGSLAHEGYGGKNAEFLAGALAKNFQAHPADIVLIHAGHNHTNTEAPVRGIVAATESMIRTVRQVNPRVVVLLAQVIPSGKLPKYAYLPELNQELSKLAARLNTREQPVILVNQTDGFDWQTDTIQDHVHPNARGAEKMAQRWFVALTNAMETPRPSFPSQR